MDINWPPLASINRQNDFFFPPRSAPIAGLEPHVQLDARESRRRRIVSSSCDSSSGWLAGLMIVSAPLLGKKRNYKWLKNVLKFFFLSFASFFFVRILLDDCVIVIFFC
jgi:hypothetical protein